jgi:CheY-like chemotaxis protein
LSDDLAAPPFAAIRALPVVEIGYRSAGSFLASYASQISKGELFIESPTWPPVGTPLALRLSAPPATAVALEGAVAWTREARPGEPAGMAVALLPPSENFAATVDRLAAGFAGFRVLLGTGEAAPRAILGRYLRSIFTCTVVDLDTEGDRALDASALDLAVIDLDSSGPRGYEVGERLRQRARPAPMVALAQLERDRVLALKLGFDAALSNPPSFSELEVAVHRCIARPASVHHATKYGTLKGYA